MAAQHAGNIRGATIIKLENSLYGYVRAVEVRPGQPGLPGNLVHPLPCAARPFPYPLIGHIGVVGKQLDYLTSVRHVFFLAEGRTKRSYVSRSLPSVKGDAPMRNILVPHTGQTPWVAGRPFFMVMALGSFISLLTWHLAQ